MIDCAGRRSKAPDWLRRIGSGLAVDEYMPCDLHYFARHYRLRPGAAFPSTCTPPDDSQITPYGLFLVMAQDNGTFCLAVPYRRVIPAGNGSARRRGSMR